MLLATLGSVTLACTSTLMREGKLDRNESGRPSSSSWKLSIIFYGKKRKEKKADYKSSSNRKHDCLMLWHKERCSEIILQLLWGPSHSQVCCISPAWRESSSTCTSWWRVSHPQSQEHNHRSLHRPPTQNRNLSSVSGVLQLTCKQTKHFIYLNVHCREIKHSGFSCSCLWTHASLLLPVSYEVGILLREWHVLHSFTVHFFTYFINRTLQKKQI